MGARTLPPPGTVTLVLTDVEGSTDALRALGPGYEQALAEHHRVVRASIAQFDGFEVDTQGDSFFAAFQGAREALDAAAAIQVGLAEAQWPGRPLRVRIGVHTGEPQQTAVGYVGLDVHRAARISSVGHGGQVVVSAVTRALVQHDDGLAFVDLGRHLLKDFDEPQRLFQLVVRGAVDHFPPLRTAQETNLPSLHGTFVGRDVEIDEIGAALADPGARVVTLVGPGGSGKSRLALEVGRRSLGRWAHGVRLVRLSAVEDPGLVTAEIAAELGLRGDGDVAAEVRSHLSERELLLVVDNLEHLDGAGLTLSVLLASAPRLHVLATSRSPLRIAGERVVEVRPLSDDDALALFSDRTRAVTGRTPDPSDERVVRALCRRLDRLPLAIEIAAARTATLSVGDMLDLFEPKLTTAGRVDAPARQRTIAATIAWSYDLLTPRLRDLHASLALFQAGFTPAAAGAAFEASVDELETLVTASLLRRLDDPGGRTRFGMLRVVREYGLAELERTGLSPEAHARRDAWVDGVVAEAAAELRERTSPAALTALDDLLPDLRASLADSRDRGDRERTVRLVAPLERFWRAHGHVSEARDALGWALEPPDGLDPELRAQATWALGRLAVALGDADAAERALTEALAHARKLGAHRETVFALAELAFVALDRGAVEDGERRATEAVSLAERVDDPRALSSALAAAAATATERGEAGRARGLSERSLELRRRLGDRLLVANAALALGSTALADGDLDAAIPALDECLALARDLGDVQHEAGAHCCLGEVAVLGGDPAGADAHLLEALAAFVRLGNEPAAAECLIALAATRCESAPELAAQLISAAAAARERAGTAPLPVERRLERRARSLLGPALEADRSAASLSVVDAALAVGVDPGRI